MITLCEVLHKDIGQVNDWLENAVYARTLVHLSSQIGASVVSCLPWHQGSCGEGVNQVFNMAFTSHKALRV
jgi:hypothetical protein